MMHDLKYSLIFFAAMLIVGIGLFALDRMSPELYLFDIQTDALSFFRAPIEQFYISVFFSWIEWLRRADFLGVFLAVLLFGTFHYYQKLWERFFLPSSLVIITQVLLFFFLLTRPPAAPNISLPVTFLFLTFYWVVRILLPKNVAYHE